ncbi:hypothetical protein BEWA_016320 [Theileria equi strain WA]|uniref:Signal peptide containing protein n=1 Tax=Theileria equi strain WA TaxID=1537102 RepID=L1LCK2_THEEQ|nr:hypothetical protein BEWA_016320 [Theileria equi strain WA]EKX73071.1 hypothetical protein BEWA_016320 [Theileria equi strain WA]|eukprot:XP_004832523.1 hypothetical protein BEWA_016320 [Theileria equi strain WA]
MMILSLLCLVFLYKLCGCVGPLGSQSNISAEQASSVDQRIFYVEEGIEENIPILKLTAKNEGITTKLMYGEEEIWPGKKGSFCSSAILYLDKGYPKLADINTKDKRDRDRTVYRYKDGKQWKNTRETLHKNKLGALKEKYERETREAVECTAANKSAEEPQAEQDPDVIIIDDNDDLQSEMSLETPKPETPVSYPHEHVVTNAESAVSGKDDEEALQDSDTDLEAAMDIPSSPPCQITRCMFNISDPDYRISGFYEYAYNGVTCKTYTMKKEAYVEGVSDDGEFLWKYYRGRCVKIVIYSTNSSLLCRLDINDCPVITPSYFEKTEDTWNVLEDDEFHGKLYVLFSADFKGIMMDTLSLSSDIFKVIEYIDQRVFHTVIFSPKYKVTSVHNELKIWESKNGQRCTVAHFYSDKFTNLCFLVIVDSDGINRELYFEYNVERWERIEEDKFTKNLARMTEGDPQDKNPYRTTPAMIDVRMVDSRFSNTYNFILDGVSIAKHVPLPDKEIKRVLYNSVEVWRAPKGSDERCLSTEIFSRDNAQMVIVNVKIGTNFVSYSFKWMERRWVCSERSYL